MADIAVQDFSSQPAAVALVLSAADVNGDKFYANSGKTGLWVENSSGNPVTVTMLGRNKCSHSQVHDAAVVVPDAFAGFIALPIDTQRFVDGAGEVSLTYSAVANLSVAVVRLPE